MATKNLTVKRRRASKLPPLPPLILGQGFKVQCGVTELASLAVSIWNAHGGRWKPIEYFIEAREVINDALLFLHVHDNETFARVQGEDVVTSDGKTVQLERQSVFVPITEDRSIAVSGYHSGDFEIAAVTFDAILQPVARGKNKKPSTVLGSINTEKGLIQAIRRHFVKCDGSISEVGELILATRTMLVRDLRLLHEALKKSYKERARKAAESRKLSKAKA